MILHKLSLLHEGSVLSALNEIYLILKYDMCKNLNSLHDVLKLYGECFFSTTATEISNGKFNYPQEYLCIYISNSTHNFFVVGLF